MKKLRIVYMGTPGFAVAPLRNIVETGKHEVAAVVTVPDKASGRGLKIHESEVKKYALEAGLPVLQPEKLKDEEFLRTLRDINADLFIVVAFRMLPEVVWSMPEYGTFNLHASILPQYRGAAPINWAIINGEKETGVTTFFLDRTIDTGEILMQEKCPITDTDNFETLHDRLMETGTRLVAESIDRIARGETGTKPQADFGIREEDLRPAPKLNKENTRIDWNADAASIGLLIRGLSPYPAAWTEIVSPDGTATQVKIFEAETRPDAQAGEPGTVRCPDRNTLEISTGRGTVSVKSLQLAGKKRLDTKVFLAGFRNPETYIFR